MNFRFQTPLWLLLLVALAVIGVLAIRRQRRVAVLFSDVSILRTLPATLALRIKRALPWVRLLGLALVIVALARPQRGIEEFRLQTEGIAIQMCIDRSGSMAALDFNLDGQQVNRLDVIKRVFHDFVMGKGKLPGRPDDLIGLITFGGFVEPKCPLDARPRRTDPGARRRGDSAPDLRQPRARRSTSGFGRRIRRRPSATPWRWRPIG